MFCLCLIDKFKIGVIFDSVASRDCYLTLHLLYIVAYMFIHNAILYDNRAFPSFQFDFLVGLLVVR